MINFSKEINKENKFNVKELTKQAVKTIKIFYNKNNNIYNNNNNNNNFNVNYVEINNENENNNLIENLNDLIKNKEINIENSIVNFNLLPNHLNFISKDFLYSNNIKFLLLNSELFSSINREFLLVNFLKNLFNNFYEINNDFNLFSLNEQINSLKFYKIQKN